jgi:mannose-6-phosphate isomerase-like protein (cupin superfamily)
MPGFETMSLPKDVTVIAPDGGEVRILLAVAGGSFAHFALDPGKISIAVTHRTVEEIWYVVAGRGEMWRKQGDHEEVVALEPGVCLTIPLGTRFQFRSFGPEPLGAVAITMPPWPIDREEAYPVEGHWQPNL